MMSRSTSPESAGLAIAVRPHRADRLPADRPVRRRRHQPVPGDVQAIDAELTSHGKLHEFHIYDGAGHAFLSFTNPQRHRPQRAADAWPKMLAFLDRHLR
jgi:acetyl esterase/lipase